MNSESQLPTLEEIMDTPAAKLASQIRGGVGPITTSISESTLYKHIKTTLLYEGITPNTYMNILGPRGNKLDKILAIFYPTDNRRVPSLKPEDAIRGRQLHSNPHQREQTQRITLHRGSDLGLRDKESP